MDSSALKWAYGSIIATVLIISIAAMVESYTKHLTAKAAMENGYVQMREIDGYSLIWVKENK